MLLFVDVGSKFLMRNMDPVAYLRSLGLETHVKLIDNVLTEVRAL